MSPSQKRFIAHKQLEREEVDAAKILPPAARTARLPVPVTDMYYFGDEVHHNFDICGDDNNNEEDDEDEHEEGSHYSYGSEYYSTGTLSNMPASTKNDLDEAGEHHSPSLALGRRKKRQQQKTASAAPVVVVGNSIPRPSHSPRALRQFFMVRHPTQQHADGTPTRQQKQQQQSDSEIFVSSARKHEIEREQHEKEQKILQDFFPSPARSQQPIQVKDLIGLVSTQSVKKHRPQSAAAASVSHNNNASPNSLSRTTPNRPHSARAPTNYFSPPRCVGNLLLDQGLKEQQQKFSPSKNIPAAPIVPQSQSSYSLQRQQSGMNNNNNNPLGSTMFLGGATMNFLPRVGSGTMNAMGGNNRTVSGSAWLGATRTVRIVDGQ